MLTEVSGSELSIYNTPSLLIARVYLEITKVSSILIQMYSSSYLEAIFILFWRTHIILLAHRWIKKVTFMKHVVFHCRFQVQ